MNEKSNPLKYMYAPISVSSVIFQDDDIHILMYCCRLEYNPLLEGYVPTNNKVNFNFVFSPQNLKSFIVAFIQSGIVFENLNKIDIGIKKILTSLYDMAITPMYINPDEFSEPQDVNSIGVTVKPSLMTFDCALESDIRFIFLCDNKNVININGIYVNLLVDIDCLKSIISSIVKSGIIYEKFYHTSIDIDTVLYEFIEKYQVKDRCKVKEIVNNITFQSINDMFNNASVSEKEHEKAYNLLIKKIKNLECLYSITRIDNSTPFIENNNSNYIFLFAKENDAQKYIDKNNLNDYIVSKFSKNSITLYLYNCQLTYVEFIKFYDGYSSHIILCKDLMNMNTIGHINGYSVSNDVNSLRFKYHIALLKQGLSNQQTLKQFNAEVSVFEEQELILCQLLKTTSFLVPVKEACYPLLLNYTLRQPLGSGINVFTINSGDTTELPIFTDWYEFHKAFPQGNMYPVLMNIIDVFSFCKCIKADYCSINRHGNSLYIENKSFSDIDDLIKCSTSSMINSLFQEYDIKITDNEIETFIEDEEDYNAEDMAYALNLLHQNPDIYNEFKYYVFKREFIPRHMATNVFGYTVEKLFSVADLSIVSAFLSLCEFKKFPQETMNDICSKLHVQQFIIYTKEYSFKKNKNKFKYNGFSRNFLINKKNKILHIFSIM